jgi:cell division cycle protein 37
LQRALESGELEEVNKVLGKMSVEEAEDVVERLGEGGMLSLEEGVIDGTTVEGRERLKALEKEAERGRVEEVEEGVGEIEVAEPD